MTTALKICPTICENTFKRTFPPFYCHLLTLWQWHGARRSLLAEARLHWPELDIGAQREANVSIELFLLF